MNPMTLSLQTTLPLFLAIGLAILAATTTIGRQPQKVRIKVKKRS